jgi:hypothetical protein
MQSRNSEGSLSHRKNLRKKYFIENPNNDPPDEKPKKKFLSAPLHKSVDKKSINFA